MCDEVRVKERPHVRGVAAACILVVVGDERPEIGSIARLGRNLRFVDEIADLVLGRAGSSATGNDKKYCQYQSAITQGASPTAAGRR